MRRVNRWVHLHIEAVWWDSCAGRVSRCNHIEYTASDSKGEKGLLMVHLHIEAGSWASCAGCVSKGTCIEYTASSLGELKDEKGMLRVQSKLMG